MLNTAVPSLPHWEHDRDSHQGLLSRREMVPPEEVAPAQRQETVIHGERGGWPGSSCGGSGGSVVANN